MSVTSLIRQCHDAGIRLQARGDRLHVEAPVGSMTPVLREALAAHKADLLALHAMHARLHLVADTLGIPRAIVDRLPLEELQATVEQMAMCEGRLDGRGDSLPHSLLLFYLRSLADREAPSKMDG